MLAMIRDLDPHAPTLEGYLFPDTYKLSRKTTPERLCRIMLIRWINSGTSASKKPHVSAWWTNCMEVRVSGEW